MLFAMNPVAYWVTGWVELAMGLWFCYLECNLEDCFLCVFVCRGITFPVEGYRADVGPRRDSWVDINPYSPSASSSSQWLGLRFSRLLGRR